MQARHEPQKREYAVVPVREKECMAYYKPGEKT